MSVVPKFKYDLFISYAHKNDIAWGWVTEFIKVLLDELSTKSGEFTYWWDPHLRAGEHFDTTIGEAISESAVFLSVLSLAYGDSFYCKKEVEQFRQMRHPAFSLVVGGMSRMQGMVIEREFIQDRWPPELRQTTPQPFFDARSALFSKPERFVDTSPWVQSMWKVRDSIWAVLNNMREQIDGGSNIPRSYAAPTDGTSKTPVMYIAEVTDDLDLKRERLLSSLSEGKKFKVAGWDQPAAPPTSGTDVLSVHMFGRYPGKGHGPEKQPLGKTQLEASIRAQPARRPIVWIAPDVDIDLAETEEHKLFLQSLPGRSEIELLRTDLEDLKAELPKRMRVAEAPPNNNRRPRGEPIVHIWHSKENPVALSPLKQYLKEQSCIIQVFDCDSTPTERLHSRLKVCDGLIVPYTADSRVWAEDIMADAFFSRDERPTAFAAVQLPPAAEEEFGFMNLRVVPVNLRPDGEFNEMSQFLSKLEHADA